MLYSKGRFGPFKTDVGAWNQTELYVEGAFFANYFSFLLVYLMSLCLQGDARTFFISM